MFDCCACIGLAQDVEQAYRIVTSMYSRKAFLYNAHNKIVAVTFQWAVSNNKMLSLPI